MVRISNGLVGFLNILSSLVGILLIGASLYFRLSGESQCQKFIYLPVLVLGCFVLVVSIMGFVGSCQRITFFLWIYLFVMFLLIVGLFAFTVFLLIVTNKGVGEVISGKGYKEYRLGDYTNWLQYQITNEKYWLEIESCLKDAKICQFGIGANQNSKDLYNTPVKAGCCRPPESCGYTFHNATYWTKPESGKTPEDSDCMTWSNNQQSLCYSCKSCQAGVLASLRKDWRKIAIANLSALVFLIMVYSAGCCAFRNNRSGNSYRRYR